MRTALVWDDSLARYRFGPDHPLNPRRLELTLSLIHRLGLAGGDDAPIVPPRAATEYELLLAHAPEYIDAVKRAPELSPADARRYGLGTEDVPIVSGMHEAGLAIAGSTLTAAALVMEGHATRAFSVAGGLHHARRAEAAGFCIYNDLAIAIRWMQREHSARVLYIDIDAHHGDGVQWILYDDPDALTLSLHESGAFLYPGTGFIDEAGEGDGYGYSVNVPLDAHTEDASFLDAFRRTVPDVAAAYRPDVIVLQCGCDAHADDPLTHLRCTTNLYEQVVRAVGNVADRFCDGRIIMTGGGGYAIHTVVPRAWTLAWAALRGIDVPDAIPDDWLHALRLESGRDIPCTLRDAPLPSSPRIDVVTRNNERTVTEVRRRILPLITGWGLGF